MKIAIFKVLFLLQFFAVSVYAQNLSNAEYFVDTDPGVGMANPIAIAPGDSVNQNFNINVTGLVAGWHQLFIRAKDTYGRWGNQIGKTFYVYSTDVHPLSSKGLAIVRAEYFYDTDPGTGNGVPIPVIRADTIHTDRFFPVAGLIPGTHRIFIRTLNETGRWSLYKGIQFQVDTSSCNMPVTGFTYDTVTWGTPITFTNLSTNTGTGTIYKWDINNDGTIEYTTRNMVHTFPAPGVYQVRLRVENSQTCVSSLIKEVVTGPIPSSDLLIAGATTFCSGDSVILTSANEPPGYTYEWSTGATARAITVKSSGHYYVWVKNSNGVPVKSETVSVQVNPLLNASISTANATGGNANGMASVSVSGGNGTYKYSWSNGDTTQVINNLLPGTYTVNVSDGNCPVLFTGTIVNIPVTPGNLVKAEYFFDTDPGTGLAIPINIRAGDSIQFPASLPIAGLLKGFHSLYIRTKNTAGVWGQLMQKTFFVMDSSKIISSIHQQPQIIGAEYFLETDPGVGKGMPVSFAPQDSVSMNIGIPTSGMSAGYHNLFLRIKDIANRWSIYQGMLYYVYDAAYKNLVKNRKSIARVEYFFDTDPGTGNGTPITFNIKDTVDISRYVRVSGLSDGSHTLYLRAMDEVGHWSLWKRNNFTVIHVICTCPVVDFKADTVHLLGNPTTFTNLSTSINPGATYAWDVNNDGIVDYTTLNATHVYPHYGIYQAKLTIRNTDSCYASIIREVAVSPIVDPSLTITGSLSFCQGDSVIISAQPGYTYNWNTDQTTQSIIVKQSGTYSVRLTNAYGVQGFSRNIQVKVNSLPEVLLTTINASGGKNNGTAYCSVTGGTGNYSYMWSTGGTMRVENNIPAGDHWVIVNDGRCPIQKNFHLDYVPELPGNIVAAEYYFDSDPGVGNGTAMNISAGDTVTFATMVPVTNLAQGFHYFNIRTKDNFQKWSLYLSKQIYVYQAVPTPQTKKQPPLCKAESFFDSDPGVGNGNSIEVVKADSIIKDISVSATGLSAGFHKVYIRVMDTLSRWSLFRGTDFFINDLPIYPQYERPKIVAAEYFFDTDPGPGNGIPIPFNPTGDNIILDRYFPVTGLNPGTHRVFVRARDESGRWSIYGSQSFSVLHVNCLTPSPDFKTDTVNAGSATTFTNTSGNTLPGTSYQWDINNDGSVEYTSRNFTHTFPASGVYNVKLTVINTDSCKASLIHQVFVGPMPNGNLTITGNTEFCKGDSVILSAAPGFTYKWWPTGETTRSIIIKKTGSYHVWVRTTSGIEKESVTINTECHERPVVTVSITNATGGNSNGSAVASVSGGSGTFTYQWSSGSTRFYANNLAPGVYQVEVNDGYCPTIISCVIGNLPVVANDITAAEYFFNTDPGTGNGFPINLAAGDTVGYYCGLTVSGLPLGYNRLFIRTKDTQNRWSMYKDQLFFGYKTH